MLLAAHVLAPGDKTFLVQEVSVCLKGRLAGVVQMVFHKEGCRGVGGAKRVGGLSDLWMEGDTQLRAHVLESED